ncbi:glycoside hydrolase family 1 protein [Microbacteriaceae bacterium]|nr:glycoside hydrolase family 1 protein [Candidatus Saccharibacteria bacterium]
MASRPPQSFPKHFLWGASTSAHQHEGNNHNQWSVWELENAKALAAKSAYQYGDLEHWSRIKHGAKNPDNYVSGRAAGHYENYAYDLELARKMNMNAWRFSIEWSRIQPTDGAWNAEAVQHYKQYLAELKRQGLEPVVTLFHFTLPVWFAEKGGFTKRSNAQYFVNYASRLLDELGGSVRFIITLNEPEVYAMESYARGHWPPQQTNWRAAWQVMRVLAYTHNKTADMIHAKNRRFKVSIAKNSAYIYPGDDAALSEHSASFMQYIKDDYFLKKVVKRCDFIGMNFYFSDRVYGYRIHNADDHINDLGWSMHPDHLRYALERVWEKYKKPIMITENGVADSEDEHRKWWITETIIGMQTAMNNGVELIGYIHWSLLDNFEWDKGFWPRFGLFSVDYATMKRHPRPSAIWFSRLLKQLRGVQK